MREPILSVSDLTTHFFNRAGVVKAVIALDIGFDIENGSAIEEVVGANPSFPPLHSQQRHQTQGNGVGAVGRS